MKATLGNERGVTLIELMTVVAIFGLLLVVLGFSFRGWIAKYKVEDETKRLYADLMDARARAMQKKRVHFVTLATSSYRTFEDSDPAPDGDGSLDDTADTLVADSAAMWPGGLPYALNTTGLVGVGTPRFDKDGLASHTGRIVLTSSGLSPDYDCITVTTTRTRLGRFNGATCQEK